MLYDRKIKYLDYYENGERIRGAGFVKLEVRDGSLRVELSVTNLHPTDTFEREIMLYGEGREGVLGKIMISQGRGTFRQSYSDLEHIGKTGIGYGEAGGIRISLGASREIVCGWQEQKTDRSGRAGRNGEGDRRGRAGEDDKRERGRRSAEDAERDVKREAAADDVKRTGRDGEGENRGRAADGIGAERAMRLGEAGGMDGTRRSGIGEKQERGNGPTESEGMGRSGRTDAIGGEAGPERTIDGRGTEELKGASAQEGRSREEKPLRLMDDKWQQLYAIYPHIRPFGDDREYISVRPADFVIFSSESYKAANNSFLLHGYYNYKHLILTRAEKKGEIRYYIGVPGSFYEREKQVAIMFGFESFECAEEPAQAGDFGYYMMRTEL